MLTSLLMYVLSVLGWFFAILIFCLIFLATIMAAYKESSIGLLSFIVVPIVYGLCFTAIYFITMHSESMAGIRETVGHPLLTVIAMYTAIPVTMISIITFLVILEDIYGEISDDFNN